LYASFDGLGTWENVRGGWVQMTPYTADKLASVYPDDAYASFSGFGLWHWARQFVGSPPVWTEVVPLEPTAMSLANSITVDGIPLTANGITLYASFAGFGTFALDVLQPSFGWTEITPAVASTITGDFALDRTIYSNGLSTMVASFPGFGTYYYGPSPNVDNIFSEQFFYLTSDVASQLAAIPDSSPRYDFYGAFSTGFWRGTDTWTFLTGEAPYLIAQ
jgi:hypothetical protein